MDRKLKPSTIIPESLYVERQADRQLLEIIEEMGRPGYVLVARQMGKTNLLLNARRRIGELPENLFCYLDVSNFDPDLRSFFRSITDTCVAANGDRLSAAALRIEAARNDGRSKLPHKEHEAELREILRDIVGKLVICLDEIDALTKTEYSDQVFSLIRSIYFSGRTNFPEFQRLTYVLSGVAEPSEIIKNRAISPFNIGQKIYLEDFNGQEMSAFVRQAGLPFGSEVVDRIYGWTAGNPRMTWELCAKLEDLGTVEPSDVDQVVNEVYLTSFDIPPVDHIRTLAESDRDIRSALFSIHYGKSLSISEAVRSKLYLAGITGSNSISGEVSIKNRIIEEALSERWLTEVEAKTVGKYELATNLFRQERYREALDAYEAFEAETKDLTELDFFCYGKGTCQFYLADYRGALETFVRAPLKRSLSSDLYFRQRSTMGVCSLMLDDVAAAESYLKEVAYDQDARSDSLVMYCEARINLSSVLLKSSSPPTEEIVDLCREVVDLRGRYESELSSSKVASRLLYSAFYNQSTALRVSGQPAEALVALNMAIDISGTKARVFLLVERALAFETGETRKATILAVAELVVAEKISVIPRGMDGSLTFDADVATRLLVALGTTSGVSDAIWSAYVAHLFDANAGHDENADAASILMGALLIVASRRGAASLIARILEFLPSFSPSTEYRRALAVAVVLSDDDEFLRVFPYYRAAVRACEIVDETQSVDLELRVIVFCIDTLVRFEDIETAREFHREAQSDIAFLVSRLDEYTRFRSALSEYMVLALSDVSDREALDGRAKKFISSVRSIKPPADFFSEDFLVVLGGRIASRWLSGVSRQLTRASPKIGRNEVVTVRLSDGAEVSGKYKKFERDILAGKAVLLD